MNKQRSDLASDDKAVYVNFIYSFAWDVTRISFQTIAKILKTRGWEHNWLYQRFVDFNGSEGKFGSYRPSLRDGGQQVLQRTEYMSDKCGLEIVVPIHHGWCEHDKVHNDKVVLVDISLKYHLRILENGAGVCTFTVWLDGETATYVNTQFALRLGQNVSFGSSGPLAFSFLRCKTTNTEDNVTNAGGEDNQRNPAWVKNLIGKETADIFLELPEAKNFPDGSEMAPRCPGGLTLHELFNRLLLLNPHWFPDGWTLPGERKRDSVWLDWAVLPWQNEIVSGKVDLAWQWQNPYAFTIVNTAGGSRSIFPEQDSPDYEGVLRRVAVLCKMNSDNVCAGDDWKQIPLDYIRRTLPFSQGKLQNMSHDSRIFFSFSRRGALVETVGMHEIPGYFVLPSLVNLLEILRARWHLGNVLNAFLDQTIEGLVAAKLTPTEAVDQVFHWRALYSMFRRDPVPYLFDGGSVTEISDLADREFWLEKLQSSAREKLEAIDHLVQYRDFQSIDWPGILKG